MNSDFDAVIIGGGPVGSTIAYHLSRNGLDVAIVEKKKQIGYPLQCAGILSRDIFNQNELPDEVILNTVRGAFLHTRNHILNVEKDHEVAYIIDRISYDEFLLNRALKSGSELINLKAIDFDIDDGTTYLSDGSRLKSKVIVGCDGYDSKLSKVMGNSQSNFMASQMLVEIPKDSISAFRKSDDEIMDYVDTFLLDEILPGFIWCIPIGGDLYRIGLFSEHSHRRQDEILSDFLDDNFEYEIVEKYKGFIPIFNNENRIVRQRAVLIGDAAAQLKPTSGGGLLIAFNSCRIASRYIADAVRKDDLQILEGYQKEFRDTYSKEFSYQFKVQKTLSLLSDDDLDYFFMKLKENDCEKLISEYGDMDAQSRLVKEFIKRGLIFKIMPTFLFKKVGNIFGFR
jgi:geranylgeranyl reductase family protein